MVDIICEETVWIAMPDGCRLAARLWRPANGVPVPAVFEYIPYRRRDRTRKRDDSMHPRMAEAGYACLRIDIRGSGDSDGFLTDEYTEAEIQDACDAIAWMAQQPWCDGTVGMFGKSWGAFSALQVAARRPPALKAIIPVMGTDDRFREDIHHYMGALATDNFWWGCVMQVYNTQPPDAETRGDDWRDVWKARLERLRFWPGEWLEHQHRDAYWQHGSVGEDFSQIDIPVWYFGGWADAYRDTSLHLPANLDGPVRVTMGPWAHLYPHEGRPGPRIDFVGEAIAFWDRWLKGVTGALPEGAPLQFWLQEHVPPAGAYEHRPGRWVGEQVWPSPTLNERLFWLNSGTLGKDPVADHPMTHSSHLTFGAAGGDMCSFAIDGDMPGDGRLEAGGSLVFRSEVWPEEADILGQPRLALRLSVDQPLGHVAAVLYDEAPNGALSLISRGFANLAFRTSDRAPSRAVPEEEFTLDVNLHAIGWHVKPGHRIVLMLGTSYWPILWPAPKPVTLTLVPGSSRLHLPLRLGHGDAGRVFASPPDLPGTGVTSLSPGKLERHVTTDCVTGEVTHGVFIDGGVFGPVGRSRLEETGVEIGDVSERRYTIRPGDPLSARAEMRQTSRYRKGAVDTRIEAEARMWATSETFELEARVAVFLNDEAFHTSDWRHSIPRVWM
jgi:putative CocE/NonD family hydrolase